MSSSPRPPRDVSAQTRPGAERAFTLIELLVAITAGILVTLSAYALAKQGSRFFQQESRVANAQFGATVGFDRLRADISRAAFLSTANVQRDPLRCGTVSGAGVPDGLARLAAIGLSAASGTGVDTLNGLAPDTLELTGSYASSEVFPIAGVYPSTLGTGYDVYLQRMNGAYQRTIGNADLNAAADTGTDGGPAALVSIFRAGRLMQVQDAQGRREYGTITGFVVSAAGLPIVRLGQVPTIPYAAAGTACGIPAGGNLVGGLASVVSRIRYEVRSLVGAPPAGYAPLFDGGSNDGTRLDLVRVELDQTQVGSMPELDDTLEIVAEWAVDLRFGLTVSSAVVGEGGFNPTLTEHPIGNAQNYAVAGAPALSASQPEHVRAVRARLVVRTSDADRAGDLAATGGIFRYQVAEGGAYARTRTLVADVQLPNTAGLTW